jgi:hypothetical protein
LAKQATRRRGQELAHAEPVASGKIQRGTATPKQKLAGKTRSLRAEDPMKGKIKIDCQTVTRSGADLNPTKGNIKWRRAPAQCWEGDGLRKNQNGEHEEQVQIWIENKRHTPKCKHKFFIALQNVNTTNPRRSLPSLPHLIGIKTRSWLTSTLRNQK